MSNVEINLPERGKHAGGKVAIDDQDLTNHVAGFTLKHDVRHGTQLTLDIPVHQVTGLNAASVELMLPPEIAAMLEWAGWTPPPGTASVLKRNADGCPCEWRETNRVGNRSELVLGRMVPSCPEHGAETSEPNDVHGYFGLSYANYFVAPRSLLQSMPMAWQHRFTALLAEYEKAFSHLLLTTGYNVEAGKWCCLSDLTDADMERLGIKSGCTEPEDTENEHGCAPHYCTFYDRLGDEIDPHTAGVFVPGTDPVPHYDRGRTHVQRADELDGADRA